MGQLQITVRGRKADDWADIYEIFCHEAVIREMLGLPYPHTDQVRERTAEIKEGEYCLVAEATRPDSSVSVVGVLTLRTSPTRTRRKHVGSIVIGVHPQYQGRGVGSALMAAAINLADNWLGLRRLQLEVYTDNARAIALYTKFGFVREATLRRYALRDGAFVDAYAMARINERLGGRRKPDAAAAAPADVPRPVERPAITVRGAQASDWEDLYEACRTPNVYTNTMQLPNPSPDFIRKRMAEPPENFFSLIALVDGRGVGHSGVHILTGRRAHVVGLGMMVHPDYQGIGVGSALMAAVIDLAANWLQARRVELEVYPDNARAIALYEKFGFEHEGRYRDFGFQDGMYLDTLVMSRLFD